MIARPLFAIGDRPDNCAIEFRKLKIQILIPKLQDSGEDLGSDYPESQPEDDIVAAKPYNLRFQSLVTSNESNQSNPKRRKPDHKQTEEAGIILPNEKLAWG